MKKREKSRRFVRIREILIYLCPRISVLSRGNPLGELVKCKSSKQFFQTNFLEKSILVWPKLLDFRGVCQTCPTPCPDMSGTLRFPGPQNMSGSLPRYVWDLQISKCSGLVRPLCRILETFSVYVQPLHRTCPVNHFS
jgi:hypothetical protein